MIKNTITMVENIIKHKDSRIIKIECEVCKDKDRVKLFIHVDTKNEILALPLILSIEHFTNKDISFISYSILVTVDHATWGLKSPKHNSHRRYIITS